jgi:hypothetical protein
MIWLGRVVRPAVPLDELGEERVRAGGVVGRVREPQDVRILADRKVRPLAQLGQLRFQLLQEVRALLTPKWVEEWSKLLRVMPPEGT